MRRSIVLAVALVAGTAAVTSVLPADAGTRHERIVSANPENWTPHVLDGIVHAVAVVGDSVVVGGSFSRVSEADGSGTVSRSNLFAFHRATGRIHKGFQPDLDGTVHALAPGDSGSVYAGGAFERVDHRPQAGLARLHIASGSLHTSVTNLAAKGGEVRSLARRGGWLYVGGAFKTIGGQERPALARVRTSDDNVDADFDLGVADPRSGRLRVMDLALTPGGSRLVVTGNFTEVAGQNRHQIAMIDTGASPARLAAWSTDSYTGQCGSDFDTYLRGVDFAPDGSYFVVVTTGRLGGSRRMCDTAARFETRSTQVGERPTWVNHTGGDSLYAVAVTGAAVYVGGHQRWLDNPHGRNTAGPGAVSRPGIGAIHPDRGEALSWNPGRRPRGVGVQVLLPASDGLWVGSDTEGLGGERHARIGLFPRG